MKLCLTFLLLSFIFLGTACSERESAQSPSAPKGSPGPTNLIDACSLLTDKDVEKVQGAPLKNTKRSANTEGLVISHCYFMLPQVADSVVVTVTQRGNGTDGRDPKEAWAEIFHGQQKRPPESKEEGEREAGREEQEKEASAPEKIDNLGEEAFWVPRRSGGKLYVLKGNHYISIGLGSPGDKAAMQKAKALAEIALGHLAN